MSWPLLNPLWYKYQNCTRREEIITYVYSNRRLYSGSTTSNSVHKYIILTLVLFIYTGFETPHILAGIAFHHFLFISVCCIHVSFFFLHSHIECEFLSNKISFQEAIEKHICNLKMIFMFNVKQAAFLSDSRDVTEQHHFFFLNRATPFPIVFIRVWFCVLEYSRITERPKLEGTSGNHLTSLLKQGHPGQRQDDF